MTVDRNKQSKKGVPSPNLWQVGGVNTNLRGGHLVNMLARTAARLEALRETINEQNKEIMRRAAALHDEHQDAANTLRGDLDGREPGDEPALEDAYAHRLGERRSADDLMSLLSHETKNFRSKTDPATYRNPLTVAQGQSVDANEEE